MYKQHTCSRCGLKYDDYSEHSSQLCPDCHPLTRPGCLIIICIAAIIAMLIILSITGCTTSIPRPPTPTDNQGATPWQN